MTSARPAPERLDLDGLLADPTTGIIVCCGSGGVGKTTTAAALGLRLAPDQVAFRCNLVTLGEYYDVALRDVGLLVAALALAALAFDRHRTSR